MPSISTIKEVLRPTRTTIYIAGAVVLSAVVLQQLLYVFGYDVGRTVINDQSTFLVKNDTIVGPHVQEFYGRTLEIELSGTANQSQSVVRVPLQYAGLLFDTDRMQSDATKYQPLRHLVPFGGLLMSRNMSSSYYIANNGNQMEGFISEMVSGRDVEPIDARIEIIDGVVTVTDDADGASYNVPVASQAVKSAVLQGEVSVTIEPEVLEATVTSEQLAPLVEQVLSAATTDVVFTSGEASFTLNGNEEVSQYFVANDSTAGFSFDKDEIQSYLKNKLDPVFGSAPTEIVVTTVDGVEVARTSGADGFTVDAEPITNQYIEQLMAGSSASINLGLLRINPRIVYQSTYAKTQAGLSQLVDELSNQYNAAISVQEYFSGGRSASAKASEQRVAASTYKLLVAYAVGQRITDGTWNWETPILGQTTGQCFDKMIINSDNACPVEWVYSIIGATEMNNLASSLGMSQSCYGCGYTKSSTSDQLVILKKIYEAQGISSEVRDRILLGMGSQIYRSGIPSTTNYVVQDKPGFVDGYYNDTAVIYTDDGPILMSIFTNGYGWSAIQDISRQILTNANLPD